MNYSRIKLSFLILLFITFSTYSQNEIQEFERLDLEKVKNDVDTIKMEMDSTFYYINGIFQLLKESIKVFGLQQSIKICFGIIKPYLILIARYVFWLLKRKQVE